MVKYLDSRKDTGAIGVLLANLILLTFPLLFWLSAVSFCPKIRICGMHFLLPLLLTTAVTALK